MDWPLVIGQCNRLIWTNALMGLREKETNKKEMYGLVWRYQDRGCGDTLRPGDTRIEGVFFVFVLELRCWETH